MVTTPLLGLGMVVFDASFDADFVGTCGRVVAEDSACNLSHVSPRAFAKWSSTRKEWKKRRLAFIQITLPNHVMNVMISQWTFGP